MRTTDDKIDEDMSISDAFTVHGMLSGDVTVLSRGELTLHGMCCRQLVIQPGGKAIIHGLVVGRVTNLGGRLEIYGVVGSVAALAGETYVAPSAVVRDATPKA
jgi:hypothetical protein